MSTPIEILYVDDEPDIRMIAKLSLELDPGLTVRTAGTGDDALAMLLTGWTPDVVLLDVMMPEIDGPTLAGMIGRLPHCAHVPIVFMTARARGSDIASYHGLGARGVIVKPFDPITLAAELRAILARRD
jgi:CheY-like chemotaxis protein